MRSLGARQKVIIFGACVFGLGLAVLSILAQSFSKYYLQQKLISAPVDANIFFLDRLDAVALSIFSVWVGSFMIGRAGLVVDFFSPKSETNEYALSDMDFLAKKIDELAVAVVDNQRRISEVDGKILNAHERENNIRHSLPASEMADVIEDFKNKLSEIVLPEALEALARHNSIKVAEEIRDNSLRRLGGQVQALGARANRALTLGMFFAVFGLVILFFVLFLYNGYHVSVGADGFVNWLDFIASYLPRLTLVVITEVVAFYFLRLYSRTLSELRSAQNEITNVEMKLIALENARAAGDADLIKKVTEILAMTERNAVIEKSQTTVEIERERAASDAQLGTLKVLTEILHGTDKGWFGKKRD